MYLRKRTCTDKIHDRQHWIVLGRDWTVKRIEYWENTNGIDYEYGIKKKPVTME